MSEPTVTYSLWRIGVGGDVSQCNACGALVLVDSHAKDLHTAWHEGMNSHQPGED